MLVEHTVRWLSSNGWQGWRWNEHKLPGTAWGLDELGEFSEFDVRRAGKSTWLFVAPDGTEHETMRDLFATFRLRMCDCQRGSDQLELMRTVLTLVSNEIHRTDLQDFVIRGFGGNRAFMESYVHWLEQERITKCIGAAQSISTLELADEGRAILRMLNMTAAGSNIDTMPEAALRRFIELNPGHR